MRHIKHGICLVGDILTSCIERLCRALTFYTSCLKADLGDLHYKFLSLHIDIGLW